jgi:hypothetical protein
VGAPLTRFTFVKQDAAERGGRIPLGNIADTLDSSVNTLLPQIPKGSRLALVGVANAEPEDAVYLVNGITLRFVNARHSGQFTVIERRDVENILIEQKFQMSGLVDDDAFVSIGKFLGATVVISGSVDGAGSQKRLVLKALDVLTAEILAMSSVPLR